MMGVVSIPVVRKHSRNFFLCKLLRLKFRVCDEVVVYNTTILSVLTMIQRSHEVHLITVTTIGAKKRGTEVTIALILIVSHAIIIVEIKAKA